MVHDLALVLGAHAREVLLLGLGDAQAVERVLDVGRDLFPVPSLLLRGADEVVDVLEIDLVECAAPGGHRLALEDLERAEPELEHPFRLALQERDLADHIGIQALLGLEDVVRGVVPAELVLAEIDIGWLDCGHVPSAVADVAPDKGYAHNRNPWKDIPRRPAARALSRSRAPQTSPRRRRRRRTTRKPVLEPIPGREVAVRAARRRRSRWPGRVTRRRTPDASIGGVFGEFDRRAAVDLALPHREDPPAPMGRHPR